MFTGKLQTIIKFTNELNEIAFIVLCIICGILSSFGIDYKKLYNELT
jgi:hypothetical protein